MKTMTFDRREYSKRYLRNKYAERKLRGLCYRCGAHANGKSYCEVCLELAAARQRKMREKKNKHEQ